MTEILITQELQQFLNHPAPSANFPVNGNSGDNSSQRATKKLVNLAIDNGGGNSKASLNGKRVNLPALVAECIEDFSCSRSTLGGKFKYVDGSAIQRDPTIQGTTFYTGSLAFNHCPTFYGQLADGNAKVNDYLKIVLGLISMQPYAPRWKVRVFGTVQVKRQTEDVERVLRGTHTIRCFDDTADTIVEIEPELIVEEGWAIAYLETPPVVAESFRSASIEIGFKTNNWSVYDGKLQRIAGRVNSGGVVDLVEAIASTNKLVSINNCKADPFLVRQGIRNGDFLYGSTKICFKDEYDQCAVGWCRTVLASALRQILPYKQSVNSFTCAGGGFLLPGVPELASKYELLVPADADLLNLKGLEKYAEDAEVRA